LDRILSKEGVLEREASEVVAQLLSAGVPNDRNIVHRDIAGEHLASEFDDDTSIKLPDSIGKDL
jgi:hypothetical protein